MSAVLELTDSLELKAGKTLMAPRTRAAERAPVQAAPVGVRRGIRRPLQLFRFAVRPVRVEGRTASQVKEVSFNSCWQVLSALASHLGRDAD